MPAQASVSHGPLHRLPLGEQIARRLRDDILLGRIAPGTTLSQVQLCELYGTSRMPVRDALRQLAHEGLVVTNTAGNSVVAAITASDVEDSLHVQAIVYGRMARRAAARATEADLAKLDELHRAMVAAAKAGDSEELPDLNWEFHRSINRIAAAPRLAALIRSMSLPREYQLEFPDEQPRLNREHGAIVKALRAGDGEGAEKAMRAHFERAWRRLITDFEQRLPREVPA
jgi:DNA-binding GntR family transcriptional regulator